jgi:hypothetical protein
MANKGVPGVLEELVHHAVSLIKPNSIYFAYKRRVYPAI